jgi:carbon monoxide dehydrogenase subunit G
MIRIELTLQVDRPVEDVFAYVTDTAKLATWQPNLVSVTKETEVRLAQPILASLLRRQFASDYARLKEALESRDG